MRGASLSSCLTLPSVAQNHAWSSLLLPTLYQTRTLLSEPKIATTFAAANSHVNKHVRHCRNFCTTSQRQTDAEEVRHPDPIAFVDSNHYESSDAHSHTELQDRSLSWLTSITKSREKEGPRTGPKGPRYTKPSTVTAGEQAVFDRLIKGVSDPTPPEKYGEDILGEDETISEYDFDDLDSIFEAAISMMGRPQGELERNNHVSLSTPEWKIERAITPLVPEEEQAAWGTSLRLAVGDLKGKNILKNKQRERLESKCDEHRKLVLDKLDEAESDEELWQILQEFVFKLVARLSKDIKLSEERDKARRRKARKAKAEQADTTGARAERRPPTEKEELTDRMGKSDALPITSNLLILHRNYNDYCLHALRIFRQKHPTSLYAPHVISTIKGHGPMSYVLGLSSNIYNEVLYLQWKQNSDLHGMADTIDEMLGLGLEGNEATMTLIRVIAKQRRSALRAPSGQVMKEWWAMRGVVEGWRRVIDGYLKIGSLITKRAHGLMPMDEQIQRRIRRRLGHFTAS